MSEGEFSTDEAHNSRVKCPSCAEEILAEATMCKHCGRPTSQLALTGGSLIQAGVGFGIFALAVYFLWNMFAQ